MFKKWSQKPWYSLTVAGCLIVLLCVILINLPHVLSGIRTFLGFFTPVFIGIIIAYMINQLCLFYQAKLFRGVKNDTRRYLLGVFLGVITVIGCIAGAIVLVVPQLVDSVTTFANNLKSYEKAFMVFIQNWNFLSDNATKRSSLNSQRRRHLSHLGDEPCDILHSAIRIADLNGLAQRNRQIRHFLVSGGKRRTLDRMGGPVQRIPLPCLEGGGDLFRLGAHGRRILGVYLVDYAGIAAKLPAQVLSATLLHLPSPRMRGPPIMTAPPTEVRETRFFFMR